MLGAIIGDIAGSRFEFHNHKSKAFTLFHPDCRVTDDSMMTLAVAKAIMAAQEQVPDRESADFHEVLTRYAVESMQALGRKYQDAGYGGGFRQWIWRDEPQPYHSFGNGAAMRVSPAGFAALDRVEAEALADTVTAVTHDHPEGLKGARATAAVIAMARRGALKEEIRDYVRERFYSLDFRIDDIRPGYVFQVSCQESVPQAIQCFLEASSFEDTIRTAISLGGDSDTLAAIAGSIAEAYYGIPAELKETAQGYLDDDLRAIVAAWERFAPADTEDFRVLTKYIGKFTRANTPGEWILDEESDGKADSPIRMPYVTYSAPVDSFLDEFYAFADQHPVYDLTSYEAILTSVGLAWNSDIMHSADPSRLDGQTILALIMGVIRMDRFSEGMLLDFIADGTLTRWLKRLKDIDWQRDPRQISQIQFETGGFLTGTTAIAIAFTPDQAELSRIDFPCSISTPDNKVFGAADAGRLKAAFADLHVEYWEPRYESFLVLDGTAWTLTVSHADHPSVRYSGSNAWPENWPEVLRFFGIDEDESGEDDQ